MAENVELEGLPCEPVYMPLDAPLKPMESIKMQVPISVHGHAIASDKAHDLTLCFRGPNGNSFGEHIDLKLKINVGAGQSVMMETEQPAQTKAKELDEISQYKLAIKLLDNLKLGKDLGEVMTILKSVNFDEEAAIKILKDKQL